MGLLRLAVPIRRAYSTVVSAGDWIVAPLWGTYFPPSSLTSVSAELIFSSLLGLCDIFFYPFLNAFSLRSHRLGGTQLCPVVGRLRLVGTDCVQHGAALVSPHRSHPAALAANTLTPTPLPYSMDTVNCGWTKQSCNSWSSDAHKTWLYVTFQKNLSKPTWLQSPES